jgi:polysaccharide chain length determinant protein (PEP-CTERM system associated)
MVIPGKQYRPEDVLRIAWRRKWAIAVPFLVITAGTALAVAWLPNSYKSETLILVVPQRVPESYVRATVTARIEDRLQTISPQILSRPRLEQIIQEFNLYAAERRTMVMEDVVAALRKNIDVQVVRGDAFRISYIAADPGIAMQVVTRLAGLFIDENLSDREIQAEGTNDFLNAQLADARRRLIENEKAVSQYEREHANELPSQLSFNLQAAQNAEMQIQALLESINRDRDRRLLLERQIADAPVDEAVATSREAEARQVPPAIDELAAARAALAALKGRLTAEHPDVQRLTRQIATLEAKAASTAEVDQSSPPRAVEVSSPSRGRRDRIAPLRLELDNLTAQIAAKDEEEKRLRATVQTYQSRIQAAPLRHSELAELTRDQETLQQIYRTLLQKREDSNVAANLERRNIGEQFKVLEPASLPERPFSPNRLLLTAIGTALGLALGIVFAAVLEYFDTSLRSEEDVNIALGLRVLALVPLVDGADPRNRSAGIQGRAAAVVRGMVSGGRR